MLRSIPWHCRENSVESVSHNFSSCLEGESHIRRDISSFPSHISVSGEQGDASFANLEMSPGSISAAIKVIGCEGGMRISSTLSKLPSRFGCTPSFTHLVRSPFVRMISLVKWGHLSRGHFYFVTIRRGAGSLTFGKSSCYDRYLDQAVIY
jgi:hypothetical protein